MQLLDIKITNMPPLLNLHNLKNMIMLHLIKSKIHRTSIHMTLFLIYLFSNSLLLHLIFHSHKQDIQTIYIDGTRCWTLELNSCDMGRATTSDMFQIFNDNIINLQVWLRKQNTKHQPNNTIHICSRIWTISILPHISDNKLV